ncbi:MAG TPA: hypothetical protein VEF90_17705 [Xanthobacteraceae bacterium]|nr:hypothetical protein [Xanthobacteraceae bacterium]
MSSENDYRRGVFTLIGYRAYAERLEQENKALTAEVERLFKQNWKLTLALLERPVPADLPGPTFPEPTAPHIDPPPHHPDHIEPHLIVAALALDHRIAS